MAILTTHTAIRKQIALILKGVHINIMENLGEIQGSDAAEFDNKTFCGGFEEIIYTMKQKWPDTPYRIRDDT